MLYKAEKIITPKERDMEVERKTLLSWMLKVFHPGMRRRGTSMQMMLAPRTHAGNELALLWPSRGEDRELTYSTEHCHYPSSCVIV